MIGIGSAIGLLYVPGKVAMLIAWSVGDGQRWLPVDQGVMDALVVGVCLVLTALGSSWESLRDRARQWREIWRVARSNAALAPLWVSLTITVPTVVLPVGGLGWQVTVLPSQLLREVRLRQIRRITEIQDVIRHLYTADPSMSDYPPALERAEGRGLSASTAAAAATAAWLHSAQRSASSVRNVTGPAGDQVGADEQGNVPLADRPRGGHDVATEAGWLTLIAQAYHDERLMRALLDDLDQTQVGERVGLGT